ncbi:Essential recombination function protein [uncultured Caudovirales phage]|uniref:Essential recombination function protein n=1 Tax=uncultured Caudovirales phage TaxID=2100421 RepID=A0A6J5PHV4_9CAUD|nr:Essential recombination function protein [uncultured Caudovirales phage]
MQKSESITGLAVALAKAQAEVENATKDSINPHFKSKYADLAEVLNTVRPVFAKHGLSFVQMPSYAPMNDGGMMLCSVETMLLHSSGEYISNIASSPVTKSDPQGIGSAITYLRRYSLAAFAGIAQEDEDANGATQSQKPQYKNPEAPKTLTESQVFVLRDLITKAKIDEKEFVLWITGSATDNLAMVTAINFANAKASLEKRLAKALANQEPQA